jgi:hypothetical protein
MLGLLITGESTAEQGSLSSTHTRVSIGTITPPPFRLALLYTERQAGVILLADSEKRH